MPISFPQSPTLNQQVITGGKTWVWDGERWMPKLGNVLVTVGNTVPSTTNFGSFWLDSDTGDLSMYLDGAWVGVTEYAGGGGGAANLLAVTTSIVPTSNVSLDLGTPTLRWRDLYLSGNTLVLGDNQISSSAGNLVLPANTVIGSTLLNSYVATVATDLIANSAISVDVPRVSNIQILDSSFTVIDDTAVDTVEGGNIFINGSGFSSVPQVYINQTLATSVSYVSNTKLRVKVPAFPSGTYPVYVINPDGATATFVPGLSFSGFPSWNTAAGSLGSGYETNVINLSVSATSNSNVQYFLQSGSLPPGATLFQGNGTILGTYAVTNVATTYNFVIEARDQENQQTLRSFSITVNPDSINWTAPTNGTVYQENQYGVVNRALTATVASGQAINWVAANLPTNLSISGAAIVGTLTTYTSNANVTSTITATTATSNRSITRTIYWDIIGIAYTITPSSTSITEGQSVTFNVTSINVPNGTTLYWTNAGSANASDFTGGVNSGSFTINNNAGSVTLSVTSDGVDEGSETIIFQLRTGSTSGTIALTAATVSIIDVDPYWSSVVLLLKGEGSNGSTSIVDSSSSNRTFTRNGNPVISTAQYKYGSSSIYNPTGGNTGSFYQNGGSISIANLQAFTVEAWVYLLDGGRHCLIGEPYGWAYSTAWGFGIWDTNHPYNISGKPTKGICMILSPINGYGGNMIWTGQYPELNTWTHLAWVRNSSGNWSLFMNGVKGTLQNANADTHSYSQLPANDGPTGAMTFPVYIGSFDGYVGGGNSAYMAAGFNGYIDDFRITVGVARYTSNFTPPGSLPTA